MVTSIVHRGTGIFLAFGTILVCAGLIALAWSESAFAELRARIEDRILGVEQRNVRTLEQLSDTVALIELRFADGEEEQRASQSA